MDTVNHGTELPEVVYEPGERRSGLVIWREILRETWRARELAYSLFVRDLSVRYRQSVLGYLWAIVPGVATTVLFVYLKDESFLKIRDPQHIPYPAYVLFGLTIWQIFTGGLTATTQSLVQAGSLLTKINFPRECLIFASFGGVLFDVLLRALLVAGVFAWYATHPAPGREPLELAWTIVFLPLVLVPLILLTLGLGFLFALAHAAVRDTATALSMALGLFFFLVPVIYPPPKFWPKVLVNDLNPVSAFLTAAHDVTVGGEITRPASFAMACLVAVLVFFLGWRVFRIAQPLMAERV
jgi:lipopolysaccharide transport system permease protein